MTTIPQKQNIRSIFRLASVIYAEDNVASINPTQIQKKLVENALLNIKTDGYIDVQEVAEYIKTNYQITIMAEEIWRIANLPKFKETIFLCNISGKSHQICLSPSRVKTLNNKPKVPSIDDYINEFVDNINPSLEKNDTRHLIHRFLFNVFTSNTDNFNRLINNNNLLEVTIPEYFNVDERNIINGFLNWNNPGKNKAIYNVASFALEYCMLTNTGSTTITLEVLRNKVFYLDTNIIFRAIGVNGDLRKKRALSILEKFKEVREILKITKVTDDELHHSIDHHLAIIDKYDNPNVNANVFLEQMGSIEDFYTFYQQWKRTKSNPSLTLFKAYLLELYDQLINRFNIEKEVFSPYDKTVEKYKNIIASYTQELLEYKKCKFENKAKHDAENVLWVEQQRGQNQNTIFGAKCFLLSSDHGLQLWDYSRSNQVPLVFLPSQWLSISLRFIERTNDDFSSFVNFLNLPYNDAILDSDKMLVVLSGISEVASDYQNQSKLYHRFIEERTAKAITELSDESLHSEAREFAKSELEAELTSTQKALEAANKHNSDLLKCNQILAEQGESEKEKLQKELEVHKNREKTTGSKIESLENQLEKYKSKDEKRKNRNSFIFATLGMIVIILIAILAFCFHDWQFNYIAIIVDWVDSFDETRKNWAMSIIAVSYCALFVWYGKKWLKIFKRFIRR